MRSLDAGQHPTSHRNFGHYRFTDSEAEKLNPWVKTLGLLTPKSDGKMMYFTQLLTALIQLFLVIWGIYIMLFAIKVVSTHPATWAGQVIGRISLALIRLPFLAIGGAWKALINRAPRRRRIKF